jgi:hypothetical protein
MHDMPTKGPLIDTIVHYNVIIYNVSSKQRHPQYMSTQDTTSQESIREELNSIDYHDAAPILFNKQIENSQLDEAHDIHKNLMSDETTSQESNTSEEPEIENSHDYYGQHTHRPPHHTKKDSLSTLSSSVNQYFQTMSQSSGTYLTKNLPPRTFPIKP